MKRLVIFVALVLVVVWCLPAFATPALKPSGKLLYNLQILGKEQCPGDDLKNTNRHTIFVSLNYHDNTTTGMLYKDLIQTNKIWLAEGDFQVVDGNACDNDGAKFQLPDPMMGGTTSDPTFAYQVWVRGLGKPADKDNPDTVYAKITTCAIEDTDASGTITDNDTIYCSTESVTVYRNTGKPKWQNVTKQLLSLCIDDPIGGNTCDTRVAIFDDMFLSYFWDYDNFGLRNCQMRFYATP